MLELSQKLIQLSCQFLEPSLSNEVRLSTHSSDLGDIRVYTLIVSKYVGWAESQKTMLEASVALDSQHQDQVPAERRGESDMCPLSLDLFDLDLPLTFP